MNLGFPYAIAIWWLLVSIPHTAKALSFPQTVEYDIIFPRRNETYEPTEYFPVVIAVQNAAAAWPFNMYVTWSATEILYPDINNASTLLLRRDSAPELSAGTYSGPINASFTDSPPADPLIFTGVITGQLGWHAVDVRKRYSLILFGGFESNCTDAEEKGTLYQGLAAVGSMSFGILTGGKGIIEGLSESMTGDCPADALTAVNITDYTRAETVAALDTKDASQGIFNCPFLSEDRLDGTNPCGLAVPDTIMEDVKAAVLNFSRAQADEQGCYVAGEYPDLHYTCTNPDSAASDNLWRSSGLGAVAGLAMTFIGAVIFQGAV